MIAVMLVIGLAATWLLGALDPNGFPVRFLAVLASIVAFVAAVTRSWAGCCAIRGTSRVGGSKYLPLSKR